MGAAGPVTIALLVGVLVFIEAAERAPDAHAAADGAARRDKASDNAISVVDAERDKAVEPGATRGPDAAAGRAVRRDKATLFGAEADRGEVDEK